MLQDGVKLKNDLEFQRKYKIYITKCHNNDFW